MDDTIESSDFILAQEELYDNYAELDSLLNRVGLAATTEFGMEDEKNIAIISEFIGHDISLEENDLNLFKNKLIELYESLNGIIFTKFKSLVPLSNKTSHFKTAELLTMAEKIKSGELVPDLTIDPKRANALNSKLAVFYSSGYSLETSCSDLQKYMEGVVSLTGRNGKYLKGMMDMYEKLNSPDTSLNIPKLNGSLNVKNSMTGLVDNIDRKFRISDFRMSIVNNWFGSKVEFLMVSNSNKRGIRVHVDTYNSNIKKHITKTNNTDALKLIDSVVKMSSKLDAIHKALSITIKIIARNNTMQLLKSASGKGNTHRFLVAKYAEGTNKSLINLYRNITTFDSIVLQYLKLTYTKPTSTKTPKIKEKVTST